MIELKRITTSHTELYQYVEELLTTSFPLEEYRPLKQWQKFTDSNELFQNNVILDGSKPVGLMTYWDFGEFYYIEHFAIDTELRNRGYGQRVLDLLNDEIQKPLVLEVEIPDNETARRRVSFYKRYNFTLWDEEYTQPPYRPNGKAIPMILMSRGDLSCKKDFKKVRNLLYKEVYSMES